MASARVGGGDGHPAHSELHSARHFSQSAARPRARRANLGSAVMDVPVSNGGGDSSGFGSSIYASTVISLDRDEAEEGRRSKKLNDQQWVLQRKKIGLSRRTKRSLLKVEDSRSHHRAVLRFIQRNFNRKECVRFVEDKSRRGKSRPMAATPGPDDAPVCHCGKPEDEHHSRAEIVHSDHAKLRKATTFEAIDEVTEEGEEDSEEDSWRRRRRRRFSGESTASSELPPDDGGRRGRRRPVIKVGSGSAGSLERVDRDRGRDSVEEYIERKLAQMESASSGLNAMTSVETENSLRMESEVDPRRRRQREDGRRDRGAEAEQQTMAAPITLTTNPESQEWDPRRSLQEFPTNAFGQIEFVNEDEGSLKPSKYIRLSDQTPMHLVKELLVEHWGLFQPFRPHLALSLIGGAKNFRMEGRKKEIFKQGLLAASKSTNALILTGGTNTGSMKLVGDAIREGQYMVQNASADKVSRGLKLLGLCSYGYIKDFHLFVNDDVDEFSYVRYNSNVEIRTGDNSPLNGDHTHFIMIDDGSRYRFFSNYTEFITRFETMVRDPETAGGLGIPIVTLLLEGGKDAIRIVKDRLKEGISCVVIEGSGRAADIISYAYKNAVKNTNTNSYTLKEGHVAHLMRMLTDAYGGYYKDDEAEREKQMKVIMNWTMECVRYSDIITIFDIRRETHLDKKILSALLKGDKMALHQQLFLAMVWDRVDLVEEKVMVRDVLKTTAMLNETMKRALLMERVKFIELMMMNGFVMRNFLTVEILAALYNEAAARFKELSVQLRRLCDFKGGPIHLRNIHKMLVIIMKAHRMPNYEAHRPAREMEQLADKVKKKKRGSSKEGEPLLDRSQEKFDEPYVELLIWSILTNRPSLIDYFWHRCGEPVIAAVVSASIYSKLFQFYKGQKRIAKVLSKRKTLFQERANTLVELATESDPEQAVSLLEKRNNRWGGRNLMQLAAIGHLRNFIANPTCQQVVRSSWRRGFVSLPWYSCVAGLFFPPLVWTPAVKFVHGLGDDGGDFSAWQKVVVFYRCPVAKYTGTCISRLCMMALYSYVALYSFRWEYQIPELVLYGWIVVLIVDECREVIFLSYLTFPTH